MQISEDLIRQITNAVVSQMSQNGQGTSSSGSNKAPSMAGRSRIRRLPIKITRAREKARTRRKS